MKNSRLFVGGALLLLVGLAGAVWYMRTHPVTAPSVSLETNKFKDSEKTAASQGAAPRKSGENTGEPAVIIPKSAPVVTGFVGNLLEKGNPQQDGTLHPFVVGESLELRAEARNATEYRWTANGEVLSEKGQEWSKRADRDFDVTQPGQLRFTVQVRGPIQVDGKGVMVVSQEKAVSLTILPLKIVGLNKSIIHDDDERFLTGESIYLEVEMAEKMSPDFDSYQFRYFVNDTPIKHPDDDQEWTSSSDLAYTFTTPGTYTFKVEARRVGITAAEDSMELPETVVSADAVLLSFDSSPSSETGAPMGSQVNFSAFPTSRYGKSECRVGVKKINAADFNWLKEDSGSIWGDPYRTWLPIEAGTYVVRCEIREIGKEAADDFREMVFTVTDGNF